MVIARKQSSTVMQQRAAAVMIFRQEDMRFSVRRCCGAGADATQGRPWWAE